MMTFGRRLRSLMDARGQLCVGIDPHPTLLEAWSLPDDAGGLETFALSCVEALGEHVAMLKPQAALFERHGSAGMAVLERLTSAAGELGALVLLDAKRGDIGSTMQGYAEAYLAVGAPARVDALTLSPYLGFESLRPALEIAAASGGGAFVLALTSNPEGALVQRARTSSGTVAGDVLAAVKAENVGAEPMGSVGAVVAANLRELGEDVAVNGPLLAPGYGAQGGSPDDLRRLFSSVRDLVVPTTSRCVLRAGPGLASLRAAARRATDTVAQALR